jgi:hypothetical protein
MLEEFNFEYIDEKWKEIEKEILSFNQQNISRE